MEILKIFLVFLSKFTLYMDYRNIWTDDTMSEQIG